MPRKALLNTKRNVLTPTGHPIILLKSNLFNMAAVSVKRCIRRGPYEKAQMREVTEGLWDLDDKQFYLLVQIKKDVATLLPFVTNTMLRNLYTWKQIDRCNNITKIK